MKKLQRVEKIGNEKTFPQWWDVADKVCDIMRDNENTSTPHKRIPLITLQPQQGKTGCMMTTIYNFIREQARLSRTFQVIIISALSDLGLRDQTDKRLTESRSEDGRFSLGAQLDLFARMNGGGTPDENGKNIGIATYNNSSKLLKVGQRLPKNVDARLIIIDEVHLGNCKFGVIDKFLRSLGVRIGEQRHTWDEGDTINHVVCISATPFAHVMLSDGVPLRSPSLFTIINEKPTDNYNGVRKMLRNGRLRQAESLFQKSGKPTTFFLSLLQEYEKECDKHGYGTLVIRATGKAHKLLQEYIRDNNFEYKCFDSEHCNIRELNDAFERKHTTPFIVLIKGAMRAGMTLSSDANIRMWVDQDSSGVDTTVQSGVGRACGYGKNDSAYPIYCNVNAVIEVFKLYEELGREITSVPSGRQNTRGTFKKRSSYSLGRPMAPEHGRKKLRSARGTLAQHAVVRISTYNRRNLAKAILEGRVKNECRRAEHIYFDGPNAKYVGDWEKIVSLYPTFVGKHVPIKSIPSLVNTGSTGDEFIKEQSALKH